MNFGTEIIGTIEQYASAIQGKEKREVFPTIRTSVLQLLSGFLYHTGIVRILNYLINRFQQNDGGMVEYRSTVLGIRRRRNLQILMYHRINDREDYYFPAMDVRSFDRQMRYLSKNFNVLPLEDAAAMMTRNELVKNAVAITFDDGYRDNFMNAFPILKKYGLTATIFLTTGVIGNGGLLWHDRVFAAFRGTRANLLKVPGRSGKVYNLERPKDRLEALRAILRWLRQIPESRREEEINALLAELGANDKDVESDIMLNWEEVMHMKNYGITFGAHTISHPILSNLTEKEAREEICGSKETIERHIGVPVRVFAYPNGTRNDFSRMTIGILEDTGFEFAVTTIFGTNAHGDDPYQLKREGPWESSLPLFAMKRSWYKLVN